MPFLALSRPFCQRPMPFLALSRPFCQRQMPFLALSWPFCRRLMPFLAVRQRFPSVKFAESSVRLRHPERRVDPADGNAYTRQEFVDAYAGTVEWVSAAASGTDARQPTPNIPTPPGGCAGTGGLRRAAGSGGDCRVAGFQQVGPRRNGRRFLLDRRFLLEHTVPCFSEHTGRRWPCRR